MLAKNVCAKTKHTSLNPIIHYANNTVGENNLGAPKMLSLYLLI